MKNNKKNMIHNLTYRLKDNKKYIRYLFPIGIFLFLLVVFLGSRIIPAMLANNVYNIGDLNGNINNVKTGDIINYEINGYSKWRVLSVDKENGTVEVTSDSNVYDLTIEPNKTVDEYNQIFQTEADKFYDDRYVINSRTIAKSDSLTFDTKGEFWLANVNENTLMTNKTGGQDSSQIIFKERINLDDNFNKIYVIPFFEVIIPDGNAIGNIGETIDFSLGGVESWTLENINRRSYNRYGSTIGASGLVFTANTPIELPINSIYDVNEVAYSYINSFDSDAIVSSILNRRFDYLYASTKIERFGFSRNVDSLLNNPEIFGDNGYVYFYYLENDKDNLHRCVERKYNIDCNNDNDIIKLYSDGSKEYYNIRYLPKTLKFGYRPVLTLKLSDEDVGKGTNDSLHIGDNIKYESNGYRNWKVLSINEDAGTIDVISGGVVKNLSLYGIDDYNNYEEILQREVDVYKNETAVSARAITPSDVDLLVSMKDRVKSMYWYNDKIEAKTKKQSDLQTSSTLSTSEYVTSYGVGILWTDVGDYYVNNGISSSTGISKYYVRFYTKELGTFQYYLGNGNMSYIAGLRPIITLKADSVKRLSNVQKKKLDKSSEDYDKYYTSEQLKNNFKGTNSSLLFTGTGENIYDNNHLSKNDNLSSSLNDYYNVDVDLLKTVDILHLDVVFLAIIGVFIVLSISFLVIYKFLYVNRKLD